MADVLADGYHLFYHHTNAWHSGPYETEQEGEHVAIDDPDNEDLSIATAENLESIWENDPVGQPSKTWTH